MAPGEPKPPTTRTKMSYYNDTHIAPQDDPDSIAEDYAAQRAWEDEQEEGRRQYERTARCSCGLPARFNIMGPYALTAPYGSLALCRECLATARENHGSRLIATAFRS